MGRWGDEEAFELHFSSNGDETFVLAWDKPIKLNELKDLLRSREQTTPEPIELVVFSACETADFRDLCRGDRLKLLKF